MDGWWPVHSSHFLPTHLGGCGVYIVLQWFSVHVLENDRSYLVLSPLSSGGAERIGPYKMWGGYATDEAIK